jgi:signal transduction histidine kinase
LFRLDPATLNGNQVKFDHFSYNPRVSSSLSSNEVWSLFEDSFGTLWIGTGSGLNRFYQEENRFIRYTEKDGLPNNRIQCILQDDQLRLWISTNGGLSQFNLAGSQIKNFDAGDGLQSKEFNSGSCARMKDGELFFGGVEGMNSFYPNQIQDNPIPPKVVFTGFWILNEPVEIDLSGKTPFHLESGQNFIDIEFAGLDFYDPASNQYAYKLEGFDKNWIVSGNRRFVSYTNLPGGNYVFRVKAANSDGVWDEYGASLVIQVEPPYWQAWWFWMGAVFILIGLAAAGVTWRVINERNQKRRLEELVDQRTTELTEANLRLLEEIEQRQIAEQRLANKAAEEAVTSERNRLARDLHDAVSQTLFSISLLADVIPELWQIQPEEGRIRLEELRQLGRGALAEMRTLLLELRPAALVNAEFPDLLRQLTEAVTGRARIPVQLYINGDCCLPTEVKIAFYRITQEGLNNVVKYSKATQVSVNFRMQSDTAFLAIVDNGVGFDPENVSSDHLGLRIMRERSESVGAKFSIYSQKGEGTQVTVSWQKAQNQ